MPTNIDKRVKIIMPAHPLDIHTHDRLVTASVKLPTTIVDYIDEVAGARLRSRSDVMRSMLIGYLRSKGVVRKIEAGAID